GKPLGRLAAALRRRSRNVLTRATGDRTGSDSSSEFHFRQYCWSNYGFCIRYRRKSLGGQQLRRQSNRPDRLVRIYPGSNRDQRELAHSASATSRRCWQSSRIRFERRFMGRNGNRNLYVPAQPVDRLWRPIAHTSGDHPWRQGCRGGSFGDPDGLTFDAQGDLWIASATDVGGLNYGGVS